MESSLFGTNKIIIIDNFLSEDNLIRCQNRLNRVKSIPEKWFSINQKHKYKNFCNLLLSEASNYYDLSSCIGYEFWTHNNTRPPEWHYDKDEVLYYNTKIFSFPICSIVFYPIIKNLVNGNLIIENKTITPIENRLVIFSHGLYHRVEHFSGTRSSLLVNPWKTRLYKNILEL
jgi:hypothetical protein